MAFDQCNMLVPDILYVSRRARYHLIVDVLNVIFLQVNDGAVSWSRWKKLQYSYK